MIFYITNWDTKESLIGYSLLDGICLCLIILYLIVGCKYSKSWKNISKLNLKLNTNSMISQSKTYYEHLSPAEIDATINISKHYKLLTIMRISFAIAIMLQFISSADLSNFNQFCNKFDSMPNQTAQIMWGLWVSNRYIIYILITVIIYQTALAYQYFGHKNFPKYFLGLLLCFFCVCVCCASLLLFFFARFLICMCRTRIYAHTQ